MLGYSSTTANRWSTLGNEKIIEAEKCRGLGILDLRFWILDLGFGTTEHRTKKLLAES